MVKRAGAVEVGRRIRAAASQAGMSLRQLGDAIGVSRPTVYAYAAGTLLASAERLEAIARVTGVGLEYFDIGDVPVLEGDSLSLVEALLSPPDPDRAVDVASKALASGLERDPERLARLAFQAGNALLQQGRYVPATQRLREASAAFEQAGDLRGWAASLQSLGFCLTNLGELEEARRCFETALKVGEADQRWRASVALAALAEREGRFDEALRLLRQALGAHSESREAVAYIKANEANLLLTKGDYLEADPATEEALEMCHGLGLMDQSLELGAARALVLCARGRLSEASVALMRASDIADALGEEARGLWCSCVRAMLAMETGRLEEAALAAAQALAEATQRSLPRSKALTLLVLAQAALRRGDWAGAYTHAVQGAAFCEVNRYPAWRAVLLALAAAGACGAGRPADAASLLDAVREVCRCGPFGECEAWTGLAEGLRRWAIGNQAGAATAWREGARSARACGSSSLEALLLRHLEFLGDEEAASLLRERRRTVANQTVVWSDGCRSTVELLDDETWYKGLGAPERMRRPAER